jgi:hypothetical protein
MMTQSDKVSVRLRRFKEIDFVPRFEYGEMAKSANASLQSL